MEKINVKLKRSQQKLKSLPFRKIAPNIVTTLALCAGMTSIRYALVDSWGRAVFCIFLAAFLDMLDGRVARMLKGSTKFGAELDSLSDFLSFGVAPAILMYSWTMSTLPKFGWFFCLLFAICSSYRLARFNTMLDNEPEEDYWHNFFVGVPAPAAAALCVLPIMLAFEFPEIAFLRNTWFCGGVMSVVAMMMVSKFPTLSVKHMKIPTYMVVPLLVVVVFLATQMLSQPWLMLSVMTMCYALSIPLGTVLFLKVKSNHDKK